ncbi:GNAT family N-acetyltransferase [Bacillus sp. S3]|uniref:GNAT family N-acetyltransferase n=1 Tax=Bacillus sp. S3 TaxID=486398 RepID=UPI0011887992|nr:GNAT family N-acetyltransferase [Bacillus sp. S3]QCJ41413.1 GNAT family N-acetyltransferase [Bacillus sp. S3]
MSSIFQGNLGVQPYIVQRLSIANLPKVLSIQEQVVANLEKKSNLQPLTPEEFQYILEGNGLMIGAFVSQELIAFRALLVPVVGDSEHLGLDIGLSEAELPSVIYQEISNVLPEYRGNGLQKTLAKVIMEELEQETHDFRYVCTTVAPFNIPSLKDKFAQGMQIAGLKEKYGGMLRYIFVKDLNEPQRTDYKETIEVSMNDISDQQEKLAQGWRGVRMKMDSNQTIIIEYCR